MLTLVHSFEARSAAATLAAVAVLLSVIAIGGGWLARHLDRRRLRTHDRLPVLRSIPAEPDGGRSLLHFRDDHCNRRGNRAGGEELAGGRS